MRAELQRISCGAFLLFKAGGEEGKHLTYKFAVWIIFNLKSTFFDEILSFLSFLCTPPTSPLLEPQTISCHSPNTPDSFVLHDFAHVFFFNGDTLTRSSASSKFKRQIECHFLCQTFPKGSTASDALTRSVSAFVTPRIFPSAPQIDFHHVALITPSLLSSRIVSPTLAIFWGWQLV